MLGYCNNTFLSFLVKLDHRVAPPTLSLPFASPVTRYSAKGDTFTDKLTLGKHNAVFTPKPSLSGSLAWLFSYHCNLTF